MSRKSLLLWRGCAYRDQLREEERRIRSLLTRLGVEFEVTEEECCGLPLYAGGYRRESREAAEGLIARIGEFQRVVTACPACFRMLGSIYPDELGVRTPKVLHLTQFLNEKADEGVLAASRFRPLDMTVMYHDPCELGRHEGVYDEPRRLLSLVPGLRLFEPRFTREEAACCGGGGLLPAFSPSLASMIGARKLAFEDRVPEGVDAVVTACPQCTLNMRRGLELWAEDVGLGNLRILDLAQLLDEALVG
ncbi:hypothetical protein AC482_04370 [miscellaneous Crenarchaeota group-15 archaeon DG-45]|uniref:Cysteine-rich domain-containing protein n=1 Tax=miscellaneous Crenarchaeota group-15 archaeon DG-45 TaxID=1685127 RepID=A0A0M0BPG9_9ARCH|nr:MAG: hypothetical protein AC482_04370 [miscellaneous Crenarchaeota group-15 archaeon DG-45]